MDSSRQKASEADIQADRQAGRQAGWQAGRLAGRQADRQIGRQTDRQTDRQTEHADAGQKDRRVAKLGRHAVEQVPELTQAAFEVREDRLQDLLVRCGLGTIEQVVDRP